jgi:hypothetical protein
MKLCMENNKEITKYLLELRKHAESEFEKLILYVASGGLVLTITFSEKITSIDVSGDFFKWIVLTWISFSLTIVCCLLFHLSSIQAIEYSLIGQSRTSNGWNNVTKLLHYLSIMFILSGVSSFVIYAVLSLTK